MTNDENSSPHDDQVHSHAHADAEAAEGSLPLDLLLNEAAHGAAYRLRPRTAIFRMVSSLAGNPSTVAQRTAELATELQKVIQGSSEIAPQRGDRRFAAEEWQTNPVLRRVLQGYLAAGKTSQDLLDDAGLSYDDYEQAEFLIRNINEALAPANSPLLNPLAWKAFKESKGQSAIKGAKAFAKDMKSAPRLPAMVDPDAFEVGKDLAVTPGKVVFRSEMFELIQYQPTTKTVYRRPWLAVPPMINKFYAIDLAPQRSMVEYMLSQGHQVFVISWRNPTAENADWGFDAYGESMREAMDIAQAITRSKKINLYALCSGGIVSTMLLAHLKKLAQLDRVSSYGLAVAVLDQGHTGVATSVLNERTAQAAIAASAATGYLDGRSLAEIFAWLRPTDLIWGYWINNYLLGRTPPKFDVLFWNADTTRMAARLHKDFIENALANKLVKSNEAEMLGTKIDLAEIDVDTMVIAGQADHICHWESVYQTTHLLGGDTEFLLASAGHIAAIVNPPGNPRATFRTGPVTDESPEQWLEHSTVNQGSWWETYSKWVAKRGGGKVAAPKSLGSESFPPLDDAPGEYIFED